MTCRASRTDGGSPTTSRTSRSAVACGYGQILAGALGLCNFTPNDTLADGVDKNRGNFLSTFPYVAPPNQGYEHTGHR